MYRLAAGASAQSAGRIRRAVGDRHLNFHEDRDTLDAALNAGKDVPWADSFTQVASPESYARTLITTLPIFWPVST